MSRMAILTVRLTAEEERLLTKRSRGAGMKKATYVRQLIRDEPFITGADVLADALRAERKIESQAYFGRNQDFVRFPDISISYTTYRAIRRGTPDHGPGALECVSPKSISQFK